MIWQGDGLAEPVEYLRRPNDVLEGRFLWIEIDDAPVGLLEGSNATRPDVEGNGAEVGDVLEGGNVIADEVANLTLGVLAPDVDGAQPFGSEFRRVLLIEHLPVDPVGIAGHDHRPISQIRQHPGGNRAVVLDEIALGVSIARPV